MTAIKYAQVDQWAERMPCLLGFLKDLQKEEKASFSSSGRGSAKEGGTTNCPLLLCTDNECASAGCCLFNPSIMKENAPSEIQLVRRALGSPA